MLYSSISQRMGSDIIRVGMVFKNDKNEVLLVKDEINRINTQIYNIPFVDVKEFRETEIINKFNDKYGLKVNKLQGYINETKFLDDKCNEKLQVNMIGKAERINIEDAIWNPIEEIINKSEVTSNVKQCIEVFNYNSNLN